MFTNNYITYIKTKFFAGANVDTNYQTFVDCTGTTQSVYTSYFYDSAYFCNCLGFAGMICKAYCSAMPTSTNTTNSSNRIYGVWFGSGTTAPTKDDYKLEAPITSGLGINNNTIRPLVNNLEPGVYEISSSYQVTNQTEEAITISEIGVWSYLTTESSSSSTRNCFPVLMERTVLDEPITIEPGMTKVVTYKLTINQPT